MILDINLDEKKIRAKVIKKYLNSCGKNKCVCFTCGNAGKALKEVGLNVVTVGDKELLKPGKWFSYAEIANSFNRFDATSGHLPIPLMLEIAMGLKKKLGKLNIEEVYEVPTGSGETIICLAMAYPYIKFKPIRYENYAPTRYELYAPLNSLVEALFGEDNIKNKEEKI